MVKTRYLLPVTNYMHLGTLHRSRRCTCNNFVHKTLVLHLIPPDIPTHHTLTVVDTCRRYIAMAFYIATSVSLFIFATPGKGQTVNTVILPNLEPLKELGLALGVFGVVSDFYILLIPITGLIQLQLEWRRKVGVMLVFLTGLLYVIAPSVCHLHTISAQPIQSLHF